MKSNIIPITYHILKSLNWEVCYDIYKSILIFLDAKYYEKYTDSITCLHYFYSREHKEIIIREFYNPTAADELLVEFYKFFEFETNDKGVSILKLRSDAPISEHPNINDVCLSIRPYIIDLENEKFNKFKDYVESFILSSPKITMQNDYMLHREDFILENKDLTNKDKMEILKEIE